MFLQTNMTKNIPWCQLNVLWHQCWIHINSYWKNINISEGAENQSPSCYETTTLNTNRTCCRFNETFNSWCNPVLLFFFLCHIIMNCFSCTFFITSFNMMKMDFLQVAPNWLREIVFWIMFKLTFKLLYLVHKLFLQHKAEAFVFQVTFVCS